MIRTELFKLRTHRTPWVLLAILIASLLIAPIYFAIKSPDDTTGLMDAYIGVSGILTPLLATVFGGWMIGHEYRQGTLRRVLGNDARRGRLIATKAATGLVALIAGVSIAVGVGALASLASAASFGETIVWDGVLRSVLSDGFFALVIASIAFILSILLRSDTYAMLGALGVMIIVGPLLTLIPAVGKYTPSALAIDVTSWISGTGELVVSIVPASLGLLASIGVLTTAATATFQRSDI
jgi:ABC-type transport system involved in multi-copper enzyme maturation permease subunit